MQTLKEARESKGIKKIAVAEAVGVSRQTYTKYEENPKTMTIQKAEEVCAFLGYDIDEIFFGQEVS